MRTLVLALLLTAPAGALAQTAPAPAARAPSPRDQSVLRGVEAYRRQAWDEATAAFREAARLDGASALPQLYLGYVAAARGDAGSAQGFFREALRLATVAADEPHQTRARIAMAQLHEAGGSWDQARAEWETYVRFADGHAATAPAGIGRARLEALTRRASAEQEGAAVRQRIEERLRANATGANQTAPPGMVAVPPAAPR
ncbi:MAG: tetratricopeptide repeat protein [Polyangiales bacterium]